MLSRSQAIWNSHEQVLYSTALSGTPSKQSIPTVNSDSHFKHPAWTSFQMTAVPVTSCFNCVRDPKSEPSSQALPNPDPENNEQNKIAVLSHEN